MTTASKQVFAELMQNARFLTALHEAKTEDNAMLADVLRTHIRSGRPNEAMRVEAAMCANEDMVNLFRRFADEYAKETATEG
jgi:hypothetical protein